MRHQHARLSTQTLPNNNNIFKSHIYNFRIQNCVQILWFCTPKCCFIVVRCVFICVQRKNENKTPILTRIYRLGHPSISSCLVVGVVAPHTSHTEGLGVESRMVHGRERTFAFREGLFGEQEAAGGRDGRGRGGYSRGERGTCAGGLRWGPARGVDRGEGGEGRGAMGWNWKTQKKRYGTQWMCKHRKYKQNEDQSCMMDNDILIDSPLYQARAAPTQT